LSRYVPGNPIGAGTARGLAQESMHETGIPETKITAWNGGP